VIRIDCKLAMQVETETLKCRVMLHPDVVYSLFRRHRHWSLGGHFKDNSTVVAEEWGGNEAVLSDNSRLLTWGGGGVWMRQQACR